ncbi:MAG: O-antigen ligase family protein [Candidatus Moranbacteria bacterium]|nr:O-antigen ligase family protein [Candidatus Moranbacteria bacterium]
MFSYIKQLAEKLNNTKTYLVLTNVLLVFFLILFNNLGVLPMRTGDFVFFAILILAFALYRPGWAFMLFMGTIALENINLAPERLGIAVRPYQLIGGLLFLAIAIRFFSKKLYFKLAKLSWTDYLVFLIPLASLFSIFNSQNPKAELKFALILFSFAAMFILVKNYIQNSSDLKKSLPFFLSSTFVITLYGFWQNVRFAKGLSSFSVMPGRPNGTLTEPDWLGLFLILILASVYALIYFITQKSDDTKLVRRIGLLSGYSYLMLAFALLLVSVSRSAWLGAIAMTIVFLVAIFTNLKLNFREWQWKSTIKIKLGIIATFIVSLGVICCFPLTTFQLFNRAVSTGGTQKITISCESNIALPEKISSLEDLTALNCRHINLEEITAEKNQGRFVTEINRTDPNVNVRAEVYRKSFAQIKTHPILGIGWANIPTVLGKDARGANLNSSNIFLETYLGSGLIGFLSLIILLGTIFVRAIIAFFREADLEQKTFALFILTSWTGLVIFNLFNAGIMLGFFWVWLGVASALKTVSYK